MTIDLHTEARSFAQQIQDLLDPSFRFPTSVAHKRGRSMLRVPLRSDPSEVRYAVYVGADAKPRAVQLLKNRQPVASLVVSFLCSHDSSEDYRLSDLDRATGSGAPARGRPVTP